MILISSDLDGEEMKTLEVPTLTLLLIHTQIIGRTWRSQCLRTDGIFAESTQTASTEEQFMEDTFQESIQQGTFMTR